jgi:hypothetical protein
MQKGEEGDDPAGWVVCGERRHVGQQGELYLVPRHGHLFLRPRIRNIRKRCAKRTATKAPQSK